MHPVRLGRTRIEADPPLGISCFEIGGDRHGLCQGAAVLGDQHRRFEAGVDPPVGRHPHLARHIHPARGAAARQLRIPKSTISKRVAALEADLGARLLHRTSRSLALTEAGRDFLDHARAAPIEAESAEEVMRRRLAEPTGTVRLTASIPTAQALLADLLPRLAAVSLMRVLPGWTAGEVVTTLLTPIGADSFLRSGWLSTS